MVGALYEWMEDRMGRKSRDAAAPGDGSPPKGKRLADRPLKMPEDVFRRLTVRALMMGHKPPWKHVEWLMDQVPIPEDRQADMLKGL